MPSVACARCESPLSSATDECPRCAEDAFRHGDPWLGRVLEGRYRILRRIGAGATAHVHCARRLADGADVAIKSLRPGRSGDPTLRSRILREAQAMFRIRHPNVVAVTDLGELADGHIFLVMDLVVGVPLSTLLRRGPLPIVPSLQVAAQIADALATAHAQGVVHRDLKPDNVVLLEEAGEPPRVKLIDFGIASIAQALSITAPNQVLGTPGYMAPEYLRDGVASARSDLYSLGVLLYQMLSGALPYDAQPRSPLLARQLSGPPRPLSSQLATVPPDVDALVMRAIAIDPEDRPLDARGLAQELLASAGAHGASGEMG